MKKYWIRKAIMAGIGGVAVLAVIWWHNRSREINDGRVDTAACDQVLEAIYDRVVEQVLAHGTLPDGMPDVPGAENFVWLGVADMTQVEPMVREKTGRHPGDIVCVLMSSGQIVYLKADSLEE